MIEPTSPIPEMLYYQKSSLHGYGVFSKRSLQQGECIGSFTGEVMKWSDFNLKYGKDYRYCYRKMRVHQIINSKEERCFITWINEADKPENANVFLKSGKLYMKTPVRQDEELLLWYSDTNIKYKYVIKT
jgi:hypothetical protein